MKNKTLYDFREGETAEYLKKRFGIKIGIFNGTTPLTLIQDLSFSKLIRVDGKAIFRDGEDEYLMFAYKKRYATIRWNSLPKYHVVECKTKNDFGGFSFANKMPVDIYSTDENRTLESQHLNMCKNCKSELSNSFWGGWGDMTWYDAVLDYVEEEENPIVKKDGYVSKWKQISSAFRESKNWTCESCEINLEHSKHFLHVHHKNGNKVDNRRKNFECLCILCHAFEHIDKLKRNEGFSELSDFVDSHHHELKRHGNKHLGEWKYMNNTQSYLKFY